METYSLNPQILPGKPLSNNEHKKTLSIFVVIVFIAAVLSLWYLWIMSQKQAGAPAHQGSDLRSQVAELLKQAPVHASQAEIDQVTALLSKSKPTSTSAEKQNVANLLKNN